jgi:hypothetical protein
MQLPVQLVKRGRHTFGWSAVSGLAVGFTVGSPIVREVMQHGELPVYEYKE